ncbi:hypothetical protein [Nocardiopsis tropica]|uniref:Tail terminator n=1 Tax=Nocardiopsis tropica TaxID=109330 RepID=A0ABU7L2R3_9ACTN|nr:hypothetical protein [Nocardiopsis umidischolae]MEE2055831.1 hypothetical protein [Nocardiopsis umidischolae]
MSVLVEPLLIAWLTQDLNPQVEVTTETPPYLEERVPLLQVARIYGHDDGFRLDRPAVDVTAFAADRLAAARLAGRARDSVLRLWRHGAFAGAVVTDVAISTAPRWLPYDNTAVRRYAATYQITTHPA